MLYTTWSHHPINEDRRLVRHLPADAGGATAASSASASAASASASAESEAEAEAGHRSVEFMRWARRWRNASRLHAGGGAVGSAEGSVEVQALSTVAAPAPHPQPPC